MLVKKMKKIKAARNALKKSVKWLSKRINDKKTTNEIIRRKTHSKQINHKIQNNYRNYTNYVINIHIDIDLQNCFDLHATEYLGLNLKFQRSNHKYHCTVTVTIYSQTADWRCI